ncbi:hypothetical protein OKA04_14180 [Luteolibacter flavescens]|uniref:Lytic murein transglycosylase n=1 Tax=Luteolibacter flavescens TaxID=1859460 RepID=A0ABT3FQM5_9BACT|nr:hypothetical protein [Luteolibacter flavescens]MCW1885883.1 hypothetical protein [Luteolibacter flavescens]
MNAKKPQWIWSAGGLALALGAGVMIGRVSAPDGGDAATAAGDSAAGRDGKSGGPVSLTERLQQKKRAGEDRDSAKPVDRDLQSILSATSRLDRTQRLLAYLDRLPADQFAGVYDELRNSPSANLRGSERSLILQAWAERDPMGAVTFLQQGTADDWERETALSSWAAKDPQAAFAWASTAPDEGQVNNWLLGAARGIAAADPLLARDYLSQLEGRTRDQAIDAMQPYVTQFGFEYSASWVAGLSDEGLRNQASRELASDMARLDPAQAGQWNAAITDVNTRRDVSETVADRWARQDLNAARTWVEGLPEDTKSEAAEGVARQDPAGAAQWLAGLGNNPDLDGARQVYIEESFRNSPEASLDFVSNVSDQRRQQGYYWRYLGDWMRRDEAAARQWMNTNSQQLPPQLIERFNRPRQQ